jgi:hypothetical protein
MIQEEMHMKTTKERMDQSRRGILLGLVVGFCLWQLSTILDRTWHLPTGLRYAVVGLALIGWGYWATQLWRMLRFRRALLQEPPLAESLNDEYIQQKRMKALRVTFWAVLWCQAVIIIVNLFAPFDAGTGAQITILVGATTSVGAFLYLDREIQNA